MRKFTPTEIDLAKKIAEKEGKEIEYGDCFAFLDNIHLMLSKDKPEMHDVAVPLWQEHDCLEWLRKKVSGTHLISLEIPHEKERACCIFDPSVSDQREYIYLGKTLLEALLRAILEILSDEK